MSGLVDLEQGKAILDATRRKLESGEWDGMATLRATAHLVKDAYLEGRVGRWQFAADEPPERGGSNQAPTPLEHFMAGVVFWLVSQVAQFAPQFDVELEEVNADVRATFDSSAKYGLPSPGTSFQKVSVRLSIHSPSPASQVQQLVAHAEMGCHAAQSLQHPVPVSFEASLNGEALSQPWFS